jgi:tripartite-type tricarboxylate transporter receptor subunit TctC
MAFLVLSLSKLVLAQGFPSKPIHLIVPFSPSSTIDIIARIVGPKLHQVMGQPVIVENRAGAGGMIGMEAAAKASPDGYTFVIAGVGQLAMSPPLYAKPPIDPVRDFAAVSLLATGPLVIAVYPGVPAFSVKQLVEVAKKKPGQLNFGSPGVGTSPHLTGELFKILTGTNIVHIPYKGNAEAVTDLVGGQVSIVFTSASTVVSLVKAGKVRLLATTGKRRILDLPDVPTIAEAGLPDAQVLGWYGAVAPVATPKDVVARLNREIVKVVGLSDTRAKLEQQNLDPETDTPEQFAQMIKDEYARWSKVVRSAGIRLD